MCHAQRKIAAFLQRAHGGGKGIWAQWSSPQTLLNDGMKPEEKRFTSWADKANLVFR
ncbi:hypothetical protein BU24DRAFT_420152 [Aaosphaeria arxii CBS 175.79]|uniref:Uncharacterized protein n=1 Tax=Aaosphaeria arxii CBS 175.79 TaxID=1450172 RepID=A0A6A5XVY1_9PLEO|nr:uncharacterized protein BU24DRAFT_420152 [Aaosphaeria arxii CBS 175.79]KAF2017129.1 hypothetical protein BU24DRAFT_420152 [Aaosphaeria arxii CBS 175.79]